MRPIETAAAALIFTCLAAPEAVTAQPSTTIQIPTNAPPNLFAGQRSRQIAAAQIMLDRARHSPGVIDGLMGGNTRRAIEAYQQANGMAVTGRLNSALIEKLRQSHGGGLFQTYAITKDDVDGPFRNVPSGMAAKSKLDRLAYESSAELLAEKFHMSLGFLRALNPGADFSREGTTILVVRPGREQLDKAISRVEVEKAANELRAYSDGGQLVATYPTTVGSSVHPSPNTQLEVVGIAQDPTYHFDPEGSSWGPSRELTIAAGPNNPVGVVWIELSRDGFGIHGTPDPRLIGKTSSHGCVRLTNWDAAELAEAIRRGAEVTFL